MSSILNAAASDFVKCEKGLHDVMNFIEACSPSHVQKDFAECHKAMEVEQQFQAEGPAEPQGASELPSEVLRGPASVLSGLVHSTYRVLVKAYQWMQPNIGPLMKEVNSEWAQKALQFIIQKTTELIAYVTGLDDTKKIEDIVKCTCKYIICIVKALLND